MDVVLIGISSSYDDIWTHDQRCAPETPQPDAWIYIPGRMLLVFECKNDEHPLDATQISSYAHELKLLMENEGVPRATRGLRLLTKEDAKTVQAACTNVVLDVPWTTVADALEHVRDSNNVGRLGRWLSGNAASYIRSHIYPPYRGTQTVVDWLNGADTPDRRKHLRRLLDKMGTALSESAEGIEDAITFAKKGNDWDFEPGAGSAVYVKLKRGTESVEISWLGRKVHAVLWFQFIGDQAQQVGLEYYLQSSGRCASRTDANSWNEASKRHADSAVTFENELAAWIPSAPAGARMNVSAIRFRGKKRNWQGGGEEYTESFKSPQTTPQGVLDFLRKHRDEFWAFPEVATFADIEAAAGQVRKPSLSLLLSLDRQNFIVCGNDASKLQSLLKRSVEASSADRLSNCGRSA